MPNIKALRIPFSEKMNFEAFLPCSYVRNCDPQGDASFDPRGIMSTNLVEIYQEMPHYKISWKLYAFQFRRSRILKFLFFVPMFWICVHRGGASFNPRGIIWTNFVKVHWKNFKIPKIKALCLPVSEKNLKFSFFLPMFKLVTPGAEPVLPQG